MSSEKTPILGSQPSQRRSLGYHLYSIYLFTRNDFKVILYPQTAVGIFQALAGGLLTTNSTPSLGLILARLPLVAFWNWFNLLVFNLANQRLPSSVVEDSFNKPWRPIAAGRVSPDEARRLLLVLIPLGVLLSYFIGGLHETAAMLVLTWMYNDLAGADENYLARNLLNAAGFICHGSGSTVIAAGYGQYELNRSAYVWLGVIGLIVLTTIHVQDIPDIEGDAARGRLTLPIIHGQRVARISVAVGVVFWSVVCPTIWGLDVLGYLLLLSPAGLIAYRTMQLRSVSADEVTYQLWCVWLILIYLLPLYKNPAVLTQALDWGWQYGAAAISGDSCF
ncbi:hypothetical protein P170DRAFT_479197 [Aspergillus steynii IBT 23096]|uniref:UbiA prenyltransferase n=1 Tax=Aspergillus steynii IBT 23096 TaxID=1392250 RepID=A0A2I2G087_9EURO|nr:uncharacterized protein P170DRAFT_479197 [Aspergillus steynii IBT 23096]PLB46283.1 hypothetical protein P170DRAFT_479197 [Aspergillus steynii IBT 23096]